MTYFGFFGGYHAKPADGGQWASWCYPRYRPQYIFLFCYYICGFSWLHSIKQFAELHKQFEYVLTWEAWTWQKGCWMRVGCGRLNDSVVYVWSPCGLSTCKQRWNRYRHASVSPPLKKGPIPSYLTLTVWCSHFLYLLCVFIILSHTYI